MHSSLLYPMFAMVFWTIGVTLFLAKVRIRAAENGDIKLSYFRINRADNVPEYLVRSEQHYSNLFEINILFYVAALTAFTSKISSAALISLLWIYVAFRILHTLIHLGSNDVKTRFLTFLVSFLVLVIIWVYIVFSIA